MIEYNKYNPFSNCCSPPFSKSYCGIGLCAELNELNNIIYREGYTNIYNTSQPQPRIDPNDSTKSIGNAASCVLKVNVNSFPNKIYCTDCTDLQGQHLAYFSKFNDNQTYENSIDIEDCWYNNQRIYWYTTHSRFLGNGWTFSFCSDGDKFEKCRVSSGLIWIGTTNPSGLIEHHDHTIYLVCDFYDNAFIWDVVGTGYYQNNQVNKSFAPCFAPNSTYLAYRGVAQLGTITNGHYNNVNCKDIDVTLVNVSGGPYCDWKNASVSIQSDNSDVTNRLYEFNRDMGFDGADLSFPINVPFLKCNENPLSFPSGDHRVIDYNTESPHYFNDYLFGPLGRNRPPIWSEYTDQLDYIKSNDYSNTQYGEYQIPPIYKINISSTNDFGECVGLSGTHFLLYNQRSNYFNRNIENTPGTLGTGIIYDIPFVLYEDSPSGIHLPVKCYNCKGTYNKDFPCINNIVFYLNDVEIAFKNDSSYGGELSQGTVARYKGARTGNSINEYFFKDDIITLNHTYTNPLFTGCNFNNYSITLEPFYPGRTRQRVCIPKIKSSVFKNGKIPNYFTVDFSNASFSPGWIVESNKFDNPTIYDSLYRYLASAGSNCNHVIYSHTQTTPDYVLIDQTHSPSGCAADFTDCSARSWSAPNGSYILQRVMDSPGAENCKAQYSCPSTTLDSDAPDRNNRYGVQESYTYSYFNSCPTNVCDWKAIHLYIGRNTPCSGIFFALHIVYQEWPCNLPACSGVGYFITDGLREYNSCSGSIYRRNYTGPMGDPGGITLTCYRKQVIYAKNFTDDSYLVEGHTRFFDPTISQELSPIQNNIVPASSCGTRKMDGWIISTPSTTPCFNASPFPGFWVDVSGNTRTYTDIGELWNNLSWHPKATGTVSITGIY